LASCLIPYRAAAKLHFELGQAHMPWWGTHYLCEALELQIIFLQNNKKLDCLVDFENALYMAILWDDNKRASKILDLIQRAESNELDNCCTLKACRPSLFILSIIFSTC